MLLLTVFQLPASDRCNQTVAPTRCGLTAATSWCPLAATVTVGRSFTSRELDEATCELSPENSTRTTLVVRRRRTNE